MAIIVSNIKTSLEQGIPEILEAGRRQARVKAGEVERLYLVKSSVDARKRSQIHLVSTVGIQLRGGEAAEEAVLSRSHGNPQVRREVPAKTEFVTGAQPLAHPPVVAGFGPAGMFAALALARMGYCPVVLERGAAVEERVTKVQQFWQDRQLDPECNVQFGEGGAGTFSDGKLTCRISDPRCGFVVEELVAHGAPEEVRWKQKPHVGTDLLRDVVKNIRQEILSLGGRVEFHTRLTGLVWRQGRLEAVQTTAGEIPTQALVLAVGHSARDTFSMLMDEGVFLEPKPFSVGVRIEQRQEVIDRGLYGAFAGHPALPKGEYQLSHRVENRGVYTFCMCPGGFVVPSASEVETVVTNGMSEYARDAANANAALVVSVGPEDYGSHPMDGIRFQREIEHRGFVLGGRDYTAPGQTAHSFLRGDKPTLEAATRPSFANGVRPARLEELFPQEVNRMLRLGLEQFERKLPGFADAGAVLTGPETRTSSPVRVTRSPESLQALGKEGLYPCGEGAGYAGGIISAAVDGVRVAQKIMEQYRPLR